MNLSFLVRAECLKVRFMYLTKLVNIQWGIRAIIMREDEFEQDNSDLYGGFAWADRWQTVFFIFDVLVMLTSFACYVCLLRAMARHSIKENSIIYLFLVFFYFTSLVDFALILEFYMSIYVHQYKSNDTCRFISFVTTGNRLLQVCQLWHDTGYELFREMIIEIFLPE